MITIENNSNNAIIVIHEIYGVNQHMRYICESIGQQGFDVICPNLLDQDQPFHYTQEKEAYINYMESLSFSKTSRTIRTLITKLKEKYEKVFIVGFSVGATLAWMCSEEGSLDGVVGFYGSRIRNYVDLTPQCPVLLFFPQQEKSFDVADLITTLQKKDNVNTRKFDGQHGFSDPYAPKYCETSAKLSFNEMTRFLQIRSWKNSCK
ncbi:dienelactone hydrolase family protein [Pseudalkalibacillus decolorationis]|uniref:dienelactone hydrolase family protein n=1 Tax=Pseudalkalibacillus decolorationis TaxID=163879 RepID=UPI0021489EF3|nr:dienelactone hydrolase family protein [Pseudalkalibacillus decolorationis]